MTRISRIFTDALAGEPGARQALFLRTELVPQLEEALAELFEQRPMVLLEARGPDAEEFGPIEWSIVERTVARAVVVATSELSELVQPEDRLAATRELRECLAHLVERLDDKVETLHQQLDLAEAAAC